MRLQRTPRVDDALEMSLGETLGAEEAVLVIVDPADLPKSWGSIDLLAEGIGDAAYRVSPEVAAGTSAENADSMTAEQANALSYSADVFRRQAKVTYGDRHLDAKLFPAMHPHGTGSLRAEDQDGIKTSGGMHRFAKSRLLSLDARFRHSKVWIFWMLERLIKNDLYFRERKRKKNLATSMVDSAGAGLQGSSGAQGGGVKRSAAEAGFATAPAQRESAKADNYAILFGRVEPRHIPESTGWFRTREAELTAITDDHECGHMTGMVTQTQNDSSPELVAHARRGPCARPKEGEMYEYLLTRRAPTQKRPNIQADPTAAVLSCQSRCAALKKHFLQRYKRTPLGVTTNYWDRTEAQLRQSLHDHIVFWNKRRKLPDGYDPRPPKPKVTPESGPSVQQPKPKNKEDDVYYRTETARVIGELVRPVLPKSGSSVNRDILLWGFLLRAAQTHLYIHACTPLYCLKNRRACRFFFPWPEQPEQQYDENTERLALQRRHKPDDQFVVPHNLELAAFSPATVNVLLFDFVRGADQARTYAAKYVAKPEAWYHLPVSTPGEEANPVKTYLQTRNVGLPMACNRLLGYHVVRSTNPTVFLFPQFTVANEGNTFICIQYLYTEM